MYRNKIVRPVIGCIESEVWEGQSKKGTELGPKAIKDVGLFKCVQKLGYSIYDAGTVSGKDIKEKDLAFNGVGYLNQLIRNHSRDISSRSEFMLNLGGDHSVAMGSIQGLLETYGDDLRIIWVDAHADCTQPDLSPYQYFHGMPLSSLYGWIEQHHRRKGFEWIQKKLKPENVAYVAVRDIDADEAVMIRNVGVKAYTMHKVNEMGIGQVANELIKWTDNKPIHISFDIDGIDASIAPATGTQSRGGLTDREAHFLLQKLYYSQRLVGMDLVEINPTMESQPRNILYCDQRLLGEPIKGTPTVCLGMELILSAFGRGML